MGMVDVTDKPVIRRLAEARGKIYLNEKTIEAVRDGTIRKGDPLVVAEVAAMNAAKQTHLLIPHCHQIALDTIQVAFDVQDPFIEIRCLVRAQARTGVEMEALLAVSVGLNTVWDMVKYLEKNENGQYPDARIGDIEVTKKEKEEQKRGER
ncbi:MAG: cyclic pyranopterin monophosphate synthase MoaC [Deltaproteobacteria bacterium]|nr:cyclic pyranopterin monophosphate synthase MoaC [Deltaproteobacteria bacterium]